MNASIKWTSLAIALILPLSAQAHRAWMLPSATVLSGEDQWVTVDAAVSNDLFYFEHFPLQLEGIGTPPASLRQRSAPPDAPANAPVQRARSVPALQVLTPDGSEVKPENGSIGRYRTTFDLPLASKGTYKLVVANPPRHMATYSENGETKRWMGDIDTLAESLPANAENLEVTLGESRMELFITSGEPSDSVLKPTGQGLELLPITHPNDLFTDEAAEFVFLLDGQPAAGVEVTVIAGGSRYRDALGEINLTSDSDGKVTIEWPAAGMYWLDARITTSEGLSAPLTRRRAGYSATLEVLAP